MGFVGDEEEDFLDGIEAKLLLLWLHLGYIDAVIDYVSEYFGRTKEGISSHVEEVLFISMEDIGCSIVY